MPFKITMAKESPRSKGTRFFLLGTMPTDDKTITGSRLPTAHQDLLCFLAHHQTASSKREAANKTVETVKHFYNRARIPTLLDHKMAEEVEKLFDDMKIIKIQPKDRTSGKPKQRVDEFKSRLQTTMKFWPRNAMENICNEEDKKFLQSMMTDRLATMSGIDVKLSETERKVKERKEKELKRIAIQKESKMDTSCSNATLSDSDDEEEAKEVPDPLYSCAKRSHKRCVKTGVTVFIPPNILKSPKVVQSLVRNNNFIFCNIFCHARHCHSS